MSYSAIPTTPDWYSMDDKILIKAHLKGDKAAFEVLVKKHQASVGRLSYSIMKNNQGVPDVVQNVFLSVFRGLNKFRGDASFKTWLYKITVHETMRYLKKKNRWTSLIDKGSSFPDGSEVTFVVFDNKNSPEHLVLNAQTKALIQEAMSKLSDNHRIVLHLHYQEDLSVQEIAEILEIPIGSVKSRLHYARIQLKELLVPFFETHSSEEGRRHAL
ncbi:MAG: sigma-70 family RNA polymerase sigma factor [SAR324 cluster bacterium]|nr:sigma-70 family RNA polymerase sigma factor [SAR324 cluster bacterium]